MAGLTGMLTRFSFILYFKLFKIDETGGSSITGIGGMYSMRSLVNFELNVSQMGTVIHRIGATIIGILRLSSSIQV